MTLSDTALLTQLDQIVSLPSVSSANLALDTSNKAVIDYLANQFEGLGFSCEVVPCAATDSKLNLIATLGTGPGGLVLAGHTDTVPLISLGNWPKGSWIWRTRLMRSAWRFAIPMNGFSVSLYKILEQQP